MTKQKLWINISLGHLCVVAMLGFLLRSKILFSIPFIDYRNLLAAHTHFAFNGWVSFSLFALFTYTFIQAAQRPSFFPLLWVVVLSCWGMLVALLLQGFGGAALFFAAVYGVAAAWFIIRFVQLSPRASWQQPAPLLALGALASMVLSVAGPIMLGWLWGSGNVNTILHRDAQYYYLHFQYNGLFTLGVFALSFAFMFGQNAPAPARRFALLQCAAVVPTLFLSLLWHPHPLWFDVVSAVGVVLLLASLAALWPLRRQLLAGSFFDHSLSRTLWRLVLLSFIVKSILQSGTLVPELGQAVFGLRSIIIGFLHLIFLGLVSLYILAHYIQWKGLPAQKGFTRLAVWIFTAGVLMQEALLGIQGTSLLFGTNSPLYNWLLWVAAMLLFSGAVLMFFASTKARAEEYTAPVFKNDL
jgi:hypothetical protein